MNSTETSFDAQNYYNSFKEERANLKKRYDEEIEQLFIQQTNEAKEDARHYIGCYVRKCKAHDILAGVCVFSGISPVAKTIEFEKNGVYVIDSNGKKWDLFGEGVNLTLASWVNVYNFLRTGEICKVAINVLKD